VLLVVALTLGAARAGAISVGSAHDSGQTRCAALLPRVVHQADRRLQRERPDARPACVISKSPTLSERSPRPAGSQRPGAMPTLREAMLDLPPPLAA
jgi:hypothetical protein